MQLPTGAGRYTFVDPRPNPRREITVHTYRCAAANARSPVVMVIAGRRRNAGEYRDFWIADAERRGLLIVAPEFDEAQYEHPYEYNYGAMCDRNGTLAPKAGWIFPAIDAVFHDARSRMGLEAERYFLFGHSAGAQVVHRLVTFGWSPSIEHAVAANAGSYTLPSIAEDFPFGLGRMSLSDEARRDVFARPLVVLLGDRDIDVNDEQLPREPGAMRQGPHRFARGHHYMEVARTEARRLNVALAWRLDIAPGVAHSGQEMSPFAARALFGP